MINTLDCHYRGYFWIEPSLFVILRMWDEPMMLRPAGGAPGDEGSVCGPDQREHWRGGPEGADDLGAAQSAGPAAGQSST